MEQLENQVIFFWGNRTQPYSSLRPMESWSLKPFSPLAKGRWTHPNSFEVTRDSKDCMSNQFPELIES
jgi:hypothetical protein